MNRLERLHAIAVALQSKRCLTAEMLAKQFDVSVRTVYRDIRSLEAGGMPIGAEAGVGYFLADGYHLPPVMFTKEEGRALLMGGKLMEKISDPSASRTFTAALTKVRAVLDSEKKEELEGLEQRILVNPFSDTSHREANPPVLENVKEALVQHRLLQFTYFSNAKGEATERQVEPIGLVYYHQHWHLMAYCRLRQDYRDFRTDRMAKVQPLAQTYKAYKHPSLQEYLDKMVLATELQRVVIRVQSGLMRYLSDSKYQFGLVQQEEDGEYCRLTFAAFSLDYMARWLLMMLDKVEIVEPPALQEKVSIMAKILAKHWLDKD